MNIKFAYSFAASLLLLSGGAFAVSESTKVAGKSAIQVSCQISPGEISMPAGFAQGFCDKLASYLVSDFNTAFRLVNSGAWDKNTRAVRVDVRLNSTSGADVTIVSGRVSDAGVFVEESSAEVSIFSSDQPLSPSSSKTLVRGIGTQLGLTG